MWRRPMRRHRYLSGGEQERSNQARAIEVALRSVLTSDTHRTNSGAPRMIVNWLRVALFFFLFCGVTANAQTLALVGGSVYASPDATPLPDAVVVTSGGAITAIGSRSEVQIPGDARV